MLFLTKMNRLFAASLLIALVAIQLTAPIASESVLASDPTRGQDTFAFESEELGLGRQLKKDGKKKDGKKGGKKKGKAGGKTSNKGSMSM